MKSLLRHLAVLTVFWVLVILGIILIPPIVNFFTRRDWIADMSPAAVIFFVFELCTHISDKIDRSKPALTTPLIISTILLALVYLVLSVSYFAEGMGYWGIVRALVCVECGALVVFAISSRIQERRR